MAVENNSEFVMICHEDNNKKVFKNIKFFFRFMTIFIIQSSVKYKEHIKKKIQW